MLPQNPKRVPPIRPPHLAIRAVIVALLFVAIIGLAIWYLARPEPLLVQGEVETAPGSTSPHGSREGSRSWP